MTLERRKFVRVNKSFAVSYFEVEGNIKKETQSKNISEGGICFPLDRFIPAGTLLNVGIRPDTFKMPVNALAYLIWIMHNHKGRLPYEAGFKFLEIVPDQRDMLRGYLKGSLAQPGGQGVH